MGGALRRYVALPYPCLLNIFSMWVGSSFMYSAVNLSGKSKPSKNLFLNSGASYMSVTIYFSKALRF